MPFVNGLLSGCYNERISAYDWWGGLSIILISQISYCVNIGHLYMGHLSYKIIVLLITERKEQKWLVFSDKWLAPFGILFFRRGWHG